MNIEARNYLDSLLLKSPTELNDMQIAFLRARAMYLTPQERERFSMYFEQPKQEVKKKTK